MQSNWNFIEIIRGLVELGGGAKHHRCTDERNYSFVSVNHQYVPKCEIQRPSLASFKQI